MYIKLPEHIDEQAVEKLITAMARSIERRYIFQMDACNLLPTSRAARLAAEAAVCVLLAHEIGLEENADPNPVPETPVGG